MAGAGLVATVRGRGGGVRLTRDPLGITVGDVMRAMENDFAVVECLGPARYCRVAGVCGARDVFARALDAYFAVLDERDARRHRGERPRPAGALGLIRGPGPDASATARRASGPA